MGPSRGRASMTGGVVGARGRCLAALAAAVLGACGANREPADAPPRLGAGETWVYRCGGGYAFTVQVADDSVTLSRDAGSATLRHAESASGARYSSGEVTFWSRGDEAMLEAPEGSWRDCVGTRAETVWAASRLRGYEFRAVGQEPGWMAEIDPDRRIHLLLDYGEMDIFTGRPERMPGAADSTVYRAETERGEAQVTIVGRPCADAMSGEEFPATVRVRLGDAVYEGCGRPLDGQAESPLTASRWTLVEIAGAPVASDGSSPPALQLTETGSRVSGSTGCNLLSGSFTRDGDRLRFPEPLVTTRRACLDPQSTRLEQAFLQALRRTDRYSIEEGVLTLHAGAEPVARFARP